MKGFLWSVVITAMFFVAAYFGLLIGKQSEAHEIILLEIAPNQGQPGYQISYIQDNNVKYYYPVTENGKDAFLKAIGDTK